MCVCVIVLFFIAYTIYAVRNVIIPLDHYVCNRSKSWDLNTRQKCNWKYHAIIQMNIDGFAWELRMVYLQCVSNGGCSLAYTYSGPVSGKKFYCIRISQSLDPRTRMLTRSHHFEIWQDLRQRSRWDDYQISERLENCKKKIKKNSCFRNFAISYDTTHWIGLSSFKNTFDYLNRYICMAHKVPQQYPENLRVIHV